jgi:hypothetical protein
MTYGFGCSKEYKLVEIFKSMIEFMTSFLVIKDKNG